MGAAAAAGPRTVPRAGIRAGREALRGRHLENWGLVGVLDDAALVVTELVTNAFGHTGTPSVRVVVRRVPSDAVRVVVIDKRPELWPALRSARPLDGGGRGLALVEAVTTAWGCTRSSREKYVWADLKVAKGA